jgi:pilus assembly protein CpaB
MKQKLVPIISVVIGLLAFLLTQQYLHGRIKDIDELRKKIARDNVQVVVVAAAEDVPTGSSLKQNDLGKIRIDQRSVRGRTVLPEEAGFLLGRRTLFPLKKNEPILWSDIEGGSDLGMSLAPMISKKLRAISLTASGAAAVSGLIQPTDRVDILGTFSFPSKKVIGEMETVTITVLQDVTILATGQKLAKSRTQDARGASSGYSTVTVEVTPREAEILVFAQQMQGRLTLTLRNPSDMHFEQSLPEVNFEQLEKTLPELNNDRQRLIRYKAP